jgi:hypothetical protein
MGLNTGAIDMALFGALMLMVLVTTLVTPPALGRVARRAQAELFPDDVVGPPEDRPGDGGIDDLVAGAAERES